MSRGIEIEITCEHCQDTFSRLRSEVKRNEKNGSKNYCSRSCGAKANNKLKKRSGNPNMAVYAANRRDEYTEFRDYIRRLKTRSAETDKEFDLDVEFLKELWDKQEGKCVYSGVTLNTATKGKNNVITTASIDRIDSSKGYIKENVQFVSTAMNYMKSSMSHEETLELCGIIAKKHQS